ncbi:MAG: hypothetical protein KAI79_13890 [Bacteroidales bacterium]|nr:hypothetical protein [Bacteroidales bacterium]
MSSYFYWMEYKMLTLKIDNNEVEKKLTEFVKEQKKDIEEITIDALNSFFESFYRKKFNYEKKNVYKHINEINKEYNSRDLDNIALQHIQDSAGYIHDMRRKVNS